MKRIYKILSIITCVIVTSKISHIHSENLELFFRNACSDGVKVYDSPITTDTISIIYDDCANENYYDVVLLNKSHNRFFVSIYLNANFIKQGWVDCCKCGTYMYSHQCNQDGVWIFSIYNTPDVNEGQKVFYANYCDGFIDDAIPVLDFYMDRDNRYWIKTEFMFQNTLYSGWTKDFCSNIYGSCN